MIKRITALLLGILLLTACGAPQPRTDYNLLAAEWLAGDIAFAAELSYSEDGAARLAVEKTGDALRLEFLSPEPLAGLVATVCGGEIQLDYAGHSVPLSGELPAQSPVAALAELFVPEQRTELAAQREADAITVRGGIYIYSYTLVLTPELELVYFEFPNIGIKGKVV